MKIMYQKRKKKRNEMSLCLFVNVGAVLCAFYDGIRSQEFFLTVLLVIFCVYFYEGVLFYADVSTGEIALLSGSRVTWYSQIQTAQFARVL